MVESSFLHLYLRYMETKNHLGSLEFTSTSNFQLFSIQWHALNLSIFELLNQEACLKKNSKLLYLDGPDSIDTSLLGFNLFVPEFHPNMCICTAYLWQSSLGCDKTDKTDLTSKPWYLITFSFDFLFTVYVYNTKI